MNKEKHKAPLISKKTQIQNNCVFKHSTTSLILTKRVLRGNKVREAPDKPFILKGSAHME